MKEINFLALDGVELSGLLYNQNNKTNRVILAIHGMGSNCFKKRDEIIAKHSNEKNIDYFCFNNRGSELVKYLRKNIDGESEKELGGMSFEDVLEGYEDIVGAILKLKELGYTDIFLQGHSLGCTKIVYTYNQLKDEDSDLLKNIKSVILLSLVDIPNAIKIYLKEKLPEYINLAQEKINNGEAFSFMPRDCFIHPISPKTFLRYAQNNQDIDFINPMKDSKLEKLNNVDVPLFMRWGTENDMIMEKADVYVEQIRNLISNNNTDINYVEGANHSYEEKENEVATQIVEFINKI